MTSIVIPETVTDAILVSSNIVEDDADPWYVGATYNTSDEAVFNHRVWQCQEDNNIGDQPDQGAAENPPRWLDKGATNRYKMFDGKLFQGSANTDTIEITLNSTRVIDSLVFFGLAGSTLEVEVKDASDTVLYSTTVPLQSGESIDNWYDYFFAAYGQVTDLALIDLPNVQGVTIDIVIRNEGSIARCGELIVGDQRYIGDIKYGMEVGIHDYSVNDEDELGNPIIVERPYAKKASFDVQLASTAVDSVYSLLASVRATPTVIIGTTLYKSSIIYGRYKRMNIVVPGPRYSHCKIHWRGLI